MRPWTRLSLVVVALALSSTAGCAALRTAAAAASAGRPRAAAKSDRDIAACEKMCEVAGDAESNKAAVDRCKKDCRE